MVTPEIIINTSAILLSLLFEFVPPLKTWFDSRLSKQYKPLFMLGVVVASAGLLAGVSCVSPDLAYVECSKDGLLVLAKATGYALVANQVTHLYLRVHSDKDGELVG